MMKKRGFRDEGKEEITLNKLIYYNVIFFAPIIASQFLANFIASKFHHILDISPNIASNILMLLFTLIIFLIVIPYIRGRENVTGVRYSLVGFLIVGIMVAVPKMLNGDFNFMLTNFTYIAGYILLTFIYCPEVLGIDEDLSLYFKHSKQLIVIAIYFSIVFFYVLGFSHLYHQAYLEDNEAYNFSYEEEKRFSTFAYFSMITFTTIGYGDIVPASNGARFLATIEAILGMIINIIFIAILFMYISNIQSWMQKEETQLNKEEKQIKREEREIRKLKKEVEKKKKRKKK